LATVLLGLLAALAVVVIAIGGVAAARLVHPERQVVDRSPGELGLAFEDISFAAADGIRLSGWWVPAGDARATVVLLHGFLKSRIEVLDHARYLHEARFDVLLFDWRAHGRSEGSFCSLGFHERQDLTAAIDYAVVRTGRRVMALGYSMGAATGILGGADEPRLLALVADSSFATVEGSLNTAFEVVSEPKLPAFPFASIALGIASLRTGLDPADIRPVEAIARWAPRQVLLISGGRDRVVPSAESDRLVDAAGPVARLVRFPEAGHPSSGEEAFVSEPDAYRAEVLAFFEQALEAATER
jgi:uncharacterized protein